MITIARHNNSYQSKAILLLQLLGLLLLLPVFYYSDNKEFKINDESSTSVSNTMMLDYKLIEDKVMTNSYSDEKVKVLRYIATRKQPQQLTPNEGLSNTTTNTSVSVFEWAKQLLSNDDEISNFIRILENAPMKAFFFETKDVDSTSVYEKSFEFVLVESSYLYDFADSSQDVETFSEHFSKCSNNKDGCVFSNLGGDSLLIAPKPLVSEHPNSNIYGHMAAFVRRAPKNQVIQVWKLVLETYLDRILLQGDQQQQRQHDTNHNTVWLSTDGTGVAWLHIRLDPIPKYYDYEPFINENSGVIDQEISIVGDNDNVSSSSYSSLSI